MQPATPGLKIRWVKRVIRCNAPGVWQVREVIILFTFFIHIPIRSSAATFKIGDSCQELWQRVCSSPPEKTTMSGNINISSLCPLFSILH
ncbi:hypothetical protein FKM82_024481 [Ascaphus truei]